MEVRRYIVWQESCAMRALADQGRRVTVWKHPDYWAEYVTLRTTPRSSAA